MDGIDRWNDRRVELVRKQEGAVLSQRERQELNLLTRAVDYYVQQKVPGHNLKSLQKMVARMRAEGCDPFNIPAD